MSMVLFAYQEVGCRAMEVLSDLGVSIASVYTHRDDPQEKHWFRSVGAVAATLGIPVRYADPSSTTEQLYLRELRPQVLMSVYWRRLLPDSVLGMAPVAINLHGSLLPRYRGRAPVNWQILHGEREGGVSLHHMTTEPDAGDLIDQEPFPIESDDTPLDVYRNLLSASEVLLRRSALPVMEGNARRWPQLSSKATYFGARRPADGLIDFRWAAEDVRNLVRAVTDPYPGAFCFASRHRVTIWWATRPESPRTLRRKMGTAGEIQVDHSEVYVWCGDGHRLRLENVEIDAKRGHPRNFLTILRPRSILASHQGYQ